MKYQCPVSNTVCVMPQTLLFPVMQCSTALSSLRLSISQSHRKKRMRQLQKKIKSGTLDLKQDDPFELFVAATTIRYCYYAETHKILGSTYGMCVLQVRKWWVGLNTTLPRAIGCRLFIGSQKRAQCEINYIFRDKDLKLGFYYEIYCLACNLAIVLLQDFEALTPNLLARTIETVEGGGVIVLLLRSLTSLKQLYTMTMDVHARYRTEAHQQVTARFNERFILSLADCRHCIVLDDQLNILPVSTHMLHLKPQTPINKVYIVMISYFPISCQYLERTTCNFMCAWA